MRRHLGFMAVAGGLWLACAGVVCAAQSAPANTPNSAPCTVAPQPVPCGTATAPATKPSTADKFPFPEDAGSSGAASAPAAKADGAAAQPSGAAGDADAAAKKAAAADHPFPEEDTKKPSEGGFPFPGETTSSSSSSSGDDATPDTSPDAAGLKDKGKGRSRFPSGMTNKKE